jgi:pimeloyl-ACP methyl ester carboxylesterase
MVTRGPRRILAIAAFVAVAASGAFAAARLAEHAGARRLLPPGRLVDIGGRRLHVFCAGSGRPTVLLEASGPANAEQYSVVLPRLASKTTTCAYDRAGMGFSDPAPGGRTAQDMVDDLVAALGSARLPGPYVLVAGSLGGVVAELFARERPSDVLGLVTLDALTSESASYPAVAGITTKACAARWAAEFGLLRVADPFGLAKASPVAFEVTYRASTWRTVCRMLRDLPATGSQLRAAAPLRSDLPLTVVVHGEPRDLIPFARPEEERAADPTWLAAQRTFADRSRRGRLVVATGSGHLIVEDRPDLVIETVQAMVDEVALLANREHP